MSRYDEEGEAGIGTAISLSLFGAFFLMGLIGLGMWGCPQYNVWEQGLSGEAELARAEQNRQIKVNEAMAINEAAIHLAEAEITRATALATASEILASQFGGPEAYLRYLYIDMLKETGGKGRETIYIPTEAGIPILEAGRFDK